jgi:hypothetical protein
MAAYKHAAVWEAVAGTVWSASWNFIVVFSSGCQSLCERGAE